MATFLKKLSEETRNNLIEDYKNNLSIRQLSDKYGVCRKSISNFLSECGEKTQERNHYRKYFHKEDYFSIINTEEKAYWLGFMYADGYIINHDELYGQDKVGITLSSVDINHLEKFKISIQATNPITDVSRGNSKLSRILLTSQKTANDLINAGCVKNKTFLLQFPTEQQVPNKLLHHFIRGYFDGDGSISSYMKGNYLDYHINIVGPYDFIIKLYHIYSIGGYFKDKRKENSWYFSINGNQQIIMFYHWLYDDATIFLQRKYDKFQELINKYA